MNILPYISKNVNKVFYSIISPHPTTLVLLLIALLILWPASITSPFATCRYPSSLISLIQFLPSLVNSPTAILPNLTPSCNILFAILAVVPIATLLIGTPTSFNNISPPFTMLLALFSTLLVTASVTFLTVNALEIFTYVICGIFSKYKKTPSASELILMWSFVIL